MIGREGQWTRLEFPFVSSWRSIVSCACFGLPYNTHRSRLKILTPNRLTLSSYFFLSAVSFKWYPKRLRPAPAGGAAVAAATAPVHTTTAATAAAAAAEATKTSGEGVDGRRSSLGCLSDVAVGGWDITIAPSLQVIYSTAVSFVQPGGKRNNRPLKQHPWSRSVVVRPTQERSEVLACFWHLICFIFNCFGLLPQKTFPRWP